MFQAKKERKKKKTEVDTKKFTTHAVWFENDNNMKGTFFVSIVDFITLRMEYSMRSLLGLNRLIPNRLKLSEFLDHVDPVVFII
jgi:hypothetical protein